MPRAIDEEKMAELQNVDLGNPPTKDIGYQPFPKMVYLYPKDKTKSHLSKVVKDQAELEDAQAEGWRLKPHVPVVVAPALCQDYETAYETEPKRGPGRPPKTA